MPWINVYNSDYVFYRRFSLDVVDRVEDKSAVSSEGVRIVVSRQNYKKLRKALETCWVLKG